MTIGTIANLILAPAPAAAESRTLAAGQWSTTTTPTPSTSPTQSAAGTVPLIIQYKSELADVDVDQLVRDGGGQPGHRVPAIHLQVVNVPAASRNAALAQYANHPRVDRVAPAISLKSAATPNDSDYVQQWALPKIGWDRVYSSVSISGSATIAILDTGIDASHPDLVGRVGGGFSVFSGGNALSDPNGHGTAEAGIVAASTNNGVGMAGVAYPRGVSLRSVQVLGADGSGLDSDVAEGLVWAADHGAQVALMAFSTSTPSPTLADAVAYASSKGVVLVAATGNDGSSTATEYPAALNGVIGVAATDAQDSVASFSNTANAAVAAPGVGILTTLRGGSFGQLSGTSPRPHTLPAWPGCWWRTAHQQPPSPIRSLAAPTRSADTALAASMWHARSG